MCRRWSLSLTVVMLRHGVIGAGAALADIRCFEPDGSAVLEVAGGPCAVERLEQAPSKSCVDMPLDDGHDDHSSTPPLKMPSLADGASTRLTLANNPQVAAGQSLRQACHCAGCIWCLPRAWGN